MGLAASPRKHGRHNRYLLARWDVVLNSAFKWPAR